MTTPPRHPVPWNAPAGSATLLLKLVRAALPQAERSRNLNLADRLGDLGICSLNILSLVMDLEDSYDLAPEKLVEISGRTTLEDLARLCASGQTAADDPSSAH